jgi:hypothetical protein
LQCAVRGELFEREGLLGISLTKDMYLINTKEI